MLADFFLISQQVGEGENWGKDTILGGICPPRTPWRRHCMYLYSSYYTDSSINLSRQPAYFYESVLTYLCQWWLRYTTRRFLRIYIVYAPYINTMIQYYIYCDRISACVYRWVMKSCNYVDSFANRTVFVLAYAFTMDHYITILVLFVIILFEFNERFESLCKPNLFSLKSKM